LVSGISGLDLLEQTKAHTDLAGIPCIIFSNQDSDAERERAINLGADNYLVKVATNLSDLVLLIQRLSSR
jgi:DNA-binding response OmpR family regulator